MIILTAVVLKFLPLKFLCFFNNIIVKVIFLIVIAFVALYCPAIGLLLAILLVSIIQMCQRKQLSMEINNIPLTYQLALTSNPPSFPNGKFQSPITPISISNMSAFGKSKKLSKSICKKFLKNKSINPVSGRKIKRDQHPTIS